MSARDAFAGGLVVGFIVGVTVMLILHGLDAAELSHTAREAG